VSYAPHPTVEFWFEFASTYSYIAAGRIARPEVVRRLFTTKKPNPTLSTLIRLAGALGYRVELVRDAGPRSSPRRTRPAA